MNIRLVETEVDLNSFIRLPYDFYQVDPVWVPPLRSEPRSQFDPRRNPFLDHCEYALFLLEDDNRIVGRIAAFIDRVAVGPCVPSPCGATAYTSEPSEIRLRGGSARYFRGTLS